MTRTIRRATGAVRNQSTHRSLVRFAAAGRHALGNVPVERGAALCLTLEESEHWLQSRLRKVLSPTEPPVALDYATPCPRLDDEELEAIASWFGETAGTADCGR